MIVIALQIYLAESRREVTSLEMMTKLILIEKKKRRKTLKTNSLKGKTK